MIARRGSGVKFTSVPPHHDRPQRHRWELQGRGWWQDQPAVEIDSDGLTCLMGSWPALEPAAVGALGHLLLALSGRPLVPLVTAEDLARLAAEKLG